MSEFDLIKIAAIDEAVSHFFFPALALSQQRLYEDGNDNDASSDATAYDASEDLEPIRIPDTILYSYSKPILWFYFDEATGRVMKRPAKFLNTQTILEHFTEASKSRIGVRAWYVYPQEVELVTPQTSEFPVDIVSQDAVGPTGLLRFLQSPKGKGILQHYIDNKTESDGSMRNVFIHCDYSPSHFSTELYVSAKTLTLPSANTTHKKPPGGAPSSQPQAGGAGSRGASAVSLALRFSPYSNVYERRPLVSSAMMTRLRNLCKSIAHRFHRLLGYVLDSLKIVCRMDAEDKLYVLWCSSIRCHAPHVYPHLSFLLTPQGSSHEPYAIGERTRGSATISPGAGPLASRQAPSTSPRLKSAASHNSLMTLSRSSTPAEDVRKDVLEEAKRKVWSLLSNLTYEEDAAFSGASTRTKAAELSLKVSKPSDCSSATASSDTEAVAFAEDTVPCCVCREPRHRGSLVKVPLQWVLYCLMPVDKLATNWETREEVPPSVAMVCPNLSKRQFDRLVSGDEERLWLQINVGLCVFCVKDCNAGNDLMCDQEILCPAWLGIDPTFRPVTKRSQMMAENSTSSLSRRRDDPKHKDSAVILLSELLTYFHKPHSDEARGDKDPMMQLKALVSLQTKADAVIQKTSRLKTKTVATHERQLYDPVQRRRSVVSGSGGNSATAVAETESDGYRSAISFVGATKEHADAADLYKRDREGVLRRCGFGRPVVQLRFVQPVPHVYTHTLLREGKAEMLAQLSSWESLADDDRLAQWKSVADDRRAAIQAKGGRKQRRTPGGANPEVDSPDVPCNSPL